MRKYINRFAFFSIFLDNLYLPIQLGFDFRLNYVAYLFFIIFYLLAYRTVGFSAKWAVYLGAIFTVFSIVAILKPPPFSGFIKQSVLVVFHIVFAYLLLNSYKFNLEKILTDYIKIIKWVCYVAIVQFFSLKIGFVHGADFSYLGFDMGNFFMGQNRAQAWFQEPSFMAYAIMPAVFMALAKLFGIDTGLSRKETSLILLTMLLCASSTGLLGIIISLLLILLAKYPLLKRPIYLFTLFLLVPIASLLMYQVPMVQQRVDDSLALFFKSYPTSEDIDSTNLSTYALYSNFKVTQKTITSNPILGGGIGSYENSYDRYINSVIPKSPIRDRYQLNKKDANSLLFRLLAETGLIGTVLFLFFIVANRLGFSTVIRNDGYFWALNNGIFVVILLRLLRQGHYTSLGFVLFLLLLYQTKHQTIQNGRVI